MSNRKNSFEKINKENSNNSFDTRNDSKDSRTWSIGSMDTIHLNEEDVGNKNTKQRRRTRDKNINTRRNSPNPIYWKSLLDEFLKKNKAQE